MSNLLFTSIIFLITVAQVSIAEPKDTLDKVTFLNGDKISGRFNKLQDSDIELSSTIFQKNPKFIQDSVISIDLKDTRKLNALADKPKNHIAEIHFKGRFGQESKRGLVRGQLSHIDDDSLTLSTWYAGELKIQRNLIHSVNIVDSESILYSGPNSIEEWNTQNTSGSVYYKDNYLILGSKPGSFSIDMGEAKQLVLKFKVEWKTSSNLYLYLFADSTGASRPDNFYELRIDDSSIRMTKRIRNNQAGQLNRMAKPFTHRNNSAEYTIYMDKDKGEFHVFLNGEILDSFKAPNENTKILGNKLVFQNTIKNELRLSNITLKKWNGSSIAENDLKSLEKLEGEGQKILLGNGDAVIGKVNKISDSILNINLGDEDVNLPISRISNLQLPASKKNQPKMRSLDLKAHFHGGGWIILNTASIDKDFINGSNEAIGEHSFRRSAFKKIDFNIYKQGHNDVRKNLDNQSW